MLTLVGMVPLSILIPTRNAMAFLPDHLETMRSWIDLAGEIVVVDSESDDGTLEFLKKELPQARFLQHPRGLYQSWNFGIRHINGPFTYIATVGDGITREGLVHLQNVMVRHGADVVVSPPDFVDESGRKMSSNTWPVHDIISSINFSEDICLDGLLLFVVALAYVPFAVLGSSASNLYRTATLQRYPFPVNYGRNGDGAWGLLNALDIRLALTARSASFFRQHGRNYAPEEYAALDGEKRMFDAALRILTLRLEEQEALREEFLRLMPENLIASKRTVVAWRQRLQFYRSLSLPWVLNPYAWLARHRRESVQRQCLDLLRKVLHTHATPPLRSLVEIQNGSKR